MSFHKQCSCVTTITVKISKIPTVPNSSLILSGQFLPSLLHLHTSSLQSLIWILSLIVLPFQGSFLAHSLSLSYLFPVLHGSSSPWSKVGIDTSCYRKKKKNINMHRYILRHVLRHRSWTQYICSLSISKNLAICSPSCKMYSVTGEERESEFWWTNQSSSNLCSLATHISTTIFCSHREHTLFPRETTPNTIQLLHLTQRPGFLSDGKPSPTGSEVVPVIYWPQN